MEEISDNTISQQGPTATRHNYQLPRRLFHMGMGVGAATVYHLFLDYEDAVFILGATGSLIYIIEQVRINYPELSAKLPLLNRYFLRAEETLKESAALPYNMALLLTVLTFPKPISLTAIYTLAIADPLSALVGIRYGKHKIVRGKSIEGSLAFFICTMLSVLFVFLPLFPDRLINIFGLAFGVGFFTASFEMIPLKIDDNLTIPLVTATITWILSIWFGVL